jgi:hypothetical protein
LLRCGADQREDGQFRAAHDVSSTGSHGTQSGLVDSTHRPSM